MSCNTIGAKFYSDGKKVAPGLPDFPKITKYKKCNCIFWLDKAEQIETHQPGAIDDSKWYDVGGADKAEFSSIDDHEQYDANEAEFLTIDDYFEALELKLAESKNEEMYIRKKIWWAFNDRIR